MDSNEWPCEKMIQLKMTPMKNSTPSPDKIIWSDERMKWLCYDDQLIDVVIHSEDFIVPSYDYSELEKKFSQNFEWTKQVIAHMPLANEGAVHQDLRRRMAMDVNRNLKEAVKVFSERLEEKFSTLNQNSGQTDIACLLIECILESNLILADVKLAKNIDYSDLTRMLDDSQSIKSRVAREELIKSISSHMESEDKFYQMALMAIGVNALIGSILQSIIKILSNHDFNTLISKKYLISNSIKHLERICVKDFVLDDKQIRRHDRLRLYVEGYEHAGMSEAVMNKKFFAAESHHACVGMSYSISIWRETLKIFSKHLKDMRLINFDYRSNDGIFHFPTHVRVEYSK